MPGERPVKEPSFIASICRRHSAEIAVKKRWMLVYCSFLFSFLICSKLFPEIWEHSERAKGSPEMLNPPWLTPVSFKLYGPSLFRIFGMNM